VSTIMVTLYGIATYCAGLIIGREWRTAQQRLKDAEWAHFLNETRRQLNEANAALASARAEIHRLRGIGERREEVRS
jgi:hypothetical protein